MATTSVETYKPISVPAQVVSETGVKIKMQELSSAKQRWSGCYQFCSQTQLVINKIFTRVLLTTLAEPLAGCRLPAEKRPQSRSHRQSSIGRYHDALDSIAGLRRQEESVFLASSAPDSSD